MDSNDKNNSFVNEVKNDVNIRSISLAKRIIGALFDYLEENLTESIKDPDKRSALLNTIKIVFTKPEAERIVEKSTGEILAGKGLIPESYRRMDDKTWLHNIHQGEYMNGKHIGYLLAKIALMENDAPIELMESVDKYFRANYPAHGLGGRYDCSNEVEEKIEEVEQAWEQRNGIQN